MWNLLRSTRSVRSIRNFGTNKVLRDSKNPSGTGSSGSSKVKGEENITRTFHHKVSNFDKRVLVWTNKFPSMDQVPKYVPDDVMQSAMSKGRIRICNYMMAFMIAMAIYTVITGKKKKAEIMKDVEQVSDDYRTQITQEYRQELLKGNTNK